MGDFFGIICQELGQIRFLPYLQSNKLARHSFKNAGKRHKTLRSKTKNGLLLTATVVVRESALVLSLGSHKAMQRGLDDIYVYSGCMTALSLENPDLLYWTVSLHAHCSGKRCCLIFQGCSLWKHP